MKSDTDPAEGNVKVICHRNVFILLVFFHAFSLCGEIDMINSQKIFLCFEGKKAHFFAAESDGNGRVVM